MTKVDNDEIQVGSSKVGLNTNVRLTVKTLIAILGLLWLGLTTIAGYAYFNLKTEIELRNETVKKENDDLKEYIKTELKESLVIVNEDIKTMIREQGDMKGDIKVLLSKTRNLHTVSTINDDSEEEDRDDNSLDGLNLDHR